MEQGRGALVRAPLACDLPLRWSAAPHTQRGPVSSARLQAGSGRRDVASIFLWRFRASVELGIVANYQACDITIQMMGFKLQFNAIVNVTINNS